MKYNRAADLLCWFGLNMFNSVAHASQSGCTVEAFTGHLSQSLAGEQAVVQWAYTIPEGGTFQVPDTDIAYPQSPTDLPELCVVQINVTSSSESAYSFGLFLPVDWNERFL